MIVFVLFMNLFAFLLMYLDKQKAIRRQSRIPELYFYFFGFLSAAFSIILAMFLFHHKTKKVPFKYIIYLDTIPTCFLLYELYVSLTASAV